jgi:Fe-S oxidoreductase
MEEENKSNPLMCMQCGMCSGSCPETGITPLNIRTIVRGAQLKHKPDDKKLWYCTSCGECVLRCPRDVKPLEMLIELRSSFVEEGKIPLSIQKALEGTFIQKNPWNRPRAKRKDWMEDLGFDIPHISETKSKRLLFTCCIQAYDPRCMVIPVNVARIFTKGGLEFGVLGNEEACCGSDIRTMGEVGLFEELQEENMASFEKYGVKEIITLSPHCMNAIKNEYGELDIKVSHYTEVLASLLDEGAVRFNAPFKGKVIYHDPCYLGKQNKIFDEPRRILKAIEGLDLLEFYASRENSLCCEGGGGRMFYEADITYERNSEKRVREADNKNAEILATACPFCLMTLEDAAAEKDLEVKELSEIVVDLL